MKDFEDRKLIQQYLKGDEKSLELLIQKYLKPIYRFIYKNVGNQEAAEDITQEVFVKIWKNIKKFNQNKDFKPWIFQIAKYASIDYLRKKKSIPFSRFENEKGQNSLIESFVDKQPNLLEALSNKKTLSLALSFLTDYDQKIINLRHNDGMSFREISETLQESINTVKSRYRRIIISLRKNIRLN
jgi:RNA polymerase sigma-70 factor, ECF subfamily